MATTIQGVRYLTTQEAADKVGVHRKTILRAYHDNKLDATEVGKGRLLIKEADLEAYQAYYKAQGWTATDLAARFGRSRQGVHVALKRLGIEPDGYHESRFGKRTSIYGDQVVEALEGIGWEVAGDD